MKIIMYRNIYLFIVLNMFVSLSQADDKCVMPETPAIPMGADTEKQLLAAVSTVKNYQINLEKFRNCVNKKIIVIDEKTMDYKTIKKNKKFNAKLNGSYDLSVEREQSVADRLNAEIRLFKSKQKLKDREPN